MITPIIKTAAVRLAKAVQSKGITLRIDPTLTYEGGFRKKKGKVSGEIVIREFCPITIVHECVHVAQAFHGAGNFKPLGLKKPCAYAVEQASSYPSEVQALEREAFHFERNMSEGWIELLEQVILK